MSLRTGQDWKARYEDLYIRVPGFVQERADQGRKDLERLMVLAGLDENNPLWQVVLSYADEHERTEREVALKPDMANEQRQYNAGRAASAYDFALGLRDLFVKAQQQAKKLKA